MSRQHTKGPWAAVEVGQGGPADNPMPVYEIQSADGYAVIAEYVDDWNAPLLAAAPDLLEAANALAKLLNRDAVISGKDIVLPCETHDQAWNYLHEARALLTAAIEKATGGQQ